MLQDLTHLAERVSKLVAYANQLKAERAELLSRVNTVEAERDALQLELDEQRDAFASVAAVSVKHQAEIQTALQMAESAQQELLSERSQRAEEAVLLQDQLQLSLQHNLELRKVAEQTREQVSGILMRLPGAAAQE